MILLGSGQMIGPYQIVRVLGQGSMGVVYLAADPRIDRPIAVKTLRWDWAGQELSVKEMEARFLTEARLAGRLQHPGIVTIFDVGFTESLYFLAMEYVEGESLREMIGKDLAVGRRVDLICQVAEALGHAHERGVLHRDIKPGNILVSRTGQVKVTDFGVGRLLTSGTSELHKGVLLGTASYMSPEQIREERLDARSDLFSLSVVLYELLTGSRPFRGESITQVIYHILNAEPPDPRELNPELPGVTAEVFSRLLAKEAGDRPQDAAAFVREVRRLVEPVREGQSSSPKGGGWPVKRRAHSVWDPHGSVLSARRRDSRASVLLLAAVSLGLVALLLLLSTDRQNRASRPGARPDSGPGQATGESLPARPPAPSETAPPQTAQAAAPARRGRSEARAERFDKVYETRSDARFAVRPEQARIYVNGRYVGIADDWDDWGGGRTFPFSSGGAHRVRLELAGYEPRTLAVRVRPGAKTATVKIDERLERREALQYPRVPRVAGRTTGAVEFSVDPRDATVSVQGGPSGRASRLGPNTPLILSGPRVYDVTVSSPGRESITVRILVAPNAGRDRARVKLKLAPSSAGRSGAERRRQVAPAPTPSAPIIPP